MSTIIPLTLLALVSICIANYCYAIYYRRKVILPKVLDLVNDVSVEPAAKYMASHAFEDSLDLMLLIKMNKALESAPKHEVTSKGIGFFSKLNDESKEKLFEVIDGCIRLNYQVAFPVYMYARLTSKARNPTKEVGKKVLRRKVKKALITHTNDEFFKEKCA
ncbi:hypothetical protein [Vibrio vulnificus]|uniref:hypothetical protein n=1 Tax=Vibrio vulnificus TaxID=672 RepID=UPI001029EF82|nr:hypothetical protein [Vibrio vulnificus]EGR0130445.1 hypothetical protein [Vibrio vulnificus]EIJ0985198.1 hypothetical protein [Vibrio vulnificus]MCA3883112.1 hypothetical protein [Vibrio vulnificus]MCA3949446.1 hypothetical protein [Vibrio vulnificus]RZQ26348.1 hypothetical protein D8T42_20885 [Vibrio vulnificus]